jgi:hypothetical protein
MNLMNLILLDFFHFLERENFEEDKKKERGNWEKT